jgi:hypothetical protein
VPAAAYTQDLHFCRVAGAALSPSLSVCKPLIDLQHATISQRLFGFCSRSTHDCHPHELIGQLAAMRM